MLPAAFVLLAAAVVTHVEGEVARGNTYKADIGSGLVFILAPSDTGWMIGIKPKSLCSGGGDWASVVNAPYRNYNALFVDSSYGITAKEAVEKMDPRKFFFVVTCEDFKLESKRLELVMWPSQSYPQKQIDEALAKLGTSPLGQGVFKILQSKVSPADQEIEGKNYGHIDWLKFKLDVTFPSAHGKSSGVNGRVETP